MIRAIAAIDEQRGLANDQGIPWDLPTDKKFYRDKTESGIILMGHNTYHEFKKPFHNRKNYVATVSHEALREGFEAVMDARSFLEQQTSDVWVIGGAGLFASTLDLIDELYITQLEGQYNCTKFFPEFQNAFERVSRSDAYRENGITFYFELWKRRH